VPESLRAELAAVDEIPGLCRVCGRPVLVSNDPNSCTETLCSERCLAEALVAYWAAQGITAAVGMHDGYARLESIPGILFPPSRSASVPPPEEPCPSGADDGHGLSE